MTLDAFVGTTAVSANRRFTVGRRGAIVEGIAIGEDLVDGPATPLRSGGRPRDRREEEEREEREKRGGHTGGGGGGGDGGKEGEEEVSCMVKRELQTESLTVWGEDEVSPAQTTRGFSFSVNFSSTTTATVSIRTGGGDEMK